MNISRQWYATLSDPLGTTDFDGQRGVGGKDDDTNKWYFKPHGSDEWFEISIKDVTLIP